MSDPSKKSDLAQAQSMPPAAIIPAAPRAPLTMERIIMPYEMAKIPPHILAILISNIPTLKNASYVRPAMPAASPGPAMPAAAMPATAPAAARPALLADKPFISTQPSDISSITLSPAVSEAAIAIRATGADYLITSQILANSKPGDRIQRPVFITENIISADFNLPIRVNESETWSPITFADPRGLTSSAKRVKTDEACSICMLDEGEFIKMNDCDHSFHTECITRALQSKLECPLCRTPMEGYVRGPQPIGFMAYMIFNDLSIPGELLKGFILIRYLFKNGIQDERHPNPGVPYEGTIREVYIPKTIEGERALRRLKKAWDLGVIFQVGTSATTGKRNCIIWGNIPFKTYLQPGPHGFPDPDYMANLHRALDHLHIPQM